MKPTIVLLHGALGSERQMEKIADRFKSEYRVLSFNFKGHGGENPGASFSIQGFVDQMKAFVEENNLSKFSIFGFSLGGYVALKYAMTKHQEIQEIFTFGTKFNWTKESAAREVQKLNPAILEEKVPQFANLLKQTHGEENWTAVLKNTGDLMMSLGAAPSFIEEDLSNITCLVQINIGAEDDMVSIEESEVVANALPNASFKVIAEAPHPIDQLNEAQMKEISTSAIEKIY